VEYFTARNTVILALVQEGVNTLGVLTAGLNYKWHSTSQVSVPTQTEAFCVFGPIALILPLIWVIYAYRILQRDNSTEAARIVAVASGVLLLFSLLGVVWYAAIAPWVRFGCGGLSD
jgi:hypothetical protein